MCDDKCKALGPHFSLFKPGSDGTGVVPMGRFVTLETLAAKLINPSDELVALVNEIRELTKTHEENPIEANEQAKTKAKQRLHSFTPSGHYSWHRQAKQPMNFTGCTSLDIDDIEGNDDTRLAVKSAIFMQFPGARLVFVSPSGKGLKVIVAIDPIPTTNNEFTTATGQVRVDMQKFLAARHFTANVDCLLDATRVCYVSVDKDRAFDPKAPPFQWDENYVPDASSSTSNIPLLPIAEATRSAMRRIEEIATLRHGDRRQPTAVYHASFMAHQGVLKVLEHAVIEATVKSGIEQSEAERVCKSAYGYARGVRQYSQQEIDAAIEEERNNA